jgi:hypothetical protein
MEERVEHEDVQAASRLLGYFKVHARRVYAELGSPDPLELLAADLKALLVERDGRIEATATELYRLLEEREAASLPERAEELSKQALRIDERSCGLEIRRGWRKEGGRKGQTKRVLRLSLSDPGRENAVGPVVTVDPAAENIPGDNGTNGTNGNSEPSSAKSDDGDNGDSSGARDKQHDPGVDLRASSEGRKRFTV